MDTDKQNYIDMNHYDNEFKHHDTNRANKTSCFYMQILRQVVYADMFVISSTPMLNSN